MVTIDKTSIHIIICVVICLQLLSTNQVSGQSNCDLVTLTKTSLEYISVNNLNPDAPVAIYTYDQESAWYTTHCYNDCGSTISFMPNSGDDLILIYENGFYCLSREISDIPEKSDSECFITVSNNACKAVSVYEQEGNRYIGDLNAMSHPFSSPPFVSGGKSADPLSLSTGASRSYEIYNINFGPESALPLEILIATCTDSVSTFTSLCTDVAGFQRLKNTGCEPIDVLTSLGHMVTLEPDEEFSVGGSFGFETYKASLNGVLLSQGRLLQGISSIVEVDSGGRSEDGTCKDEEDPPIIVDCNLIDIAINENEIVFKALDAAPVTYAYIYNLTDQNYLFSCFNNCSPTETIDIDLAINQSKFLLGISYYDLDHHLICYRTELLN